MYFFQEFLKKEFSHENIYFWVACEHYRWLDDIEARREAAREIFKKHLDIGAVEPVNVDSQARQVSQEELQEAYPTLFVQVCLCNTLEGIKKCFKTFSIKHIHLKSL